MTDRQRPTISRRRLLALSAAGLLLPAAGLRAAEATLVVHHDPWCGCCTAWGRHMEQAGFAVEMRPAVDEDLDDIKRRLGVPEHLFACHTAEIEGYLVEGHVPADSVQRLLRDRPPARGLAVPGMPAGSPGMEGGTPEDYEVILFGPAGDRVWRRYRGSVPA